MRRTGTQVLFIISDLHNAPKNQSIQQTLELQTEERRALQAAAEAEEAAFHLRVLEERTEAESQEQTRRRARLDEAQAVAA